MIEIVIAAALIVFGILVLFFIDRTEAPGDSQALIVMIIGFLSVAAGIWIIVQGISLMVLLKKAIGLILLAVGGFLTIGFPDIDQYQPPGFFFTGTFIGLVMLIVGVYLVLF